MKTLGLDIGGSKVDIVMYDGDFKFIERIPTSRESILNLNEKINSLIRELEIDAVGIGFAGWIKNGKIFRAPNIPLDPDEIKFEIEVPYAIENDATCFAFGASEIEKIGRRIVGITLGTGIGCGLVFNGKFIDGLAGELGHITVGEEGLRCVCGGKDHLECYFSGWAFEKKYGDVKKAFKTGAVYSDRGFKILSVSIANLIMLFDPDAVVIGGGISKSLDIGILKRKILEYLSPEYSPTIVKARDEVLSAKGAALLPHRAGE